MKITGKMIDKPMLVGLLLTMIVVVGTVSLTMSSLELFPNIELPFVFVTVEYRGASPSEIEYQINDKIEQELKQINDIKNVTSMALQNYGRVVVEFEYEADNKEKKREVNDAVMNILSELPDDIETPKIEGVDVASTPVMNVLLYGEGYSYEDLTVMAEEVDKVFTSNIEGLSRVRLYGELEREVSVFVDPMELWKKQISLGEIFRFFQGGALDSPGGSIEIGDIDYPVRVLGSYKDADEVRNTILLYKNGKPIYLKDLGNIEFGIEKIRSYARYNGKPAIALAILKQRDANVLEVSEATQRVVEEIEASGLLPDGIKLAVVADQASEVRTRLRELASSALQGIIVVFIVLLFGVGFRNALLATLAVPFCFLFAIMGLFVLGESINNIVQFGLIIIIGIVVDGAIVVLESIYRHMEGGKDRVKAAYDGTEEVGRAVVSAVLTTMASFAPLFLMSGIVGEFMSYIPKTVILALVGSIIFDHAVIPVVCSKYLVVKGDEGFIVRLFARIRRWRGRKDGNLEVREAGSDIAQGRLWTKDLFKKIHAKHSKLIRVSLRHKFVVMVLALCVFVMGVLILLSRDAEFFPGIDLGKFMIYIEMPKGYNIEATDRVTKDIEQILLQYMFKGGEEEGLAEKDEKIEGKRIIKFYSSTVGSGGVSVFVGMGGGFSGPNTAQIDIDLIQAEYRNYSLDDFIAELRTELYNKITPDARVRVKTPQGGPPTGAPINAIISGNNINVLKKLAGRAEQVVKGVDGAIDIRNDYGVSKPEIRVTIDRDRAEKYDLSVQTIQSYLFAMNTGYELARYQYGTKEYKVRLRVDDKIYNRRIEDISAMAIYSERLRKPIALNQFTDIVLKSNKSYIRRENFKRSIVVSGDVDLTKRSSGEVAKEVIEILSNPDIFPLPKGYSVRFRGENEDRDKSFDDLGKAFLIGFLLMYFIIVLQFNSFLQPLAILVTVLLSVGGVSLGILLSNSNLGIMVMFGGISLAGIVVNDAIVLISYVNLLRERGRGLKEGVIEASETRLKAILLTTFTTIGGLLPLALAIGGTRSFWSPMGWAIIGGLSIATVQTLIVVPVVYVSLEEGKEKTKELCKRLLDKIKGSRNKRD